MWILKDSLSLQEINTRLRGIRSAADRQREQLLDASGAIMEATADINHYFRTTIGEAQGVKGGRKKEVVKLDMCHHT
jgi:pantothenate kinase